MIFHKLKYYYISVGDDDRMSVVSDDDGPADDGFYKICIESGEGRFEIRAMELKDMKALRDELDASIRQEEKRLSESDK